MSGLFPAIETKLAEQQAVIAIGAGWADARV
jgi:hypothetical protein